MSANHDNLYATERKRVSDFIFDEKVAGVFDDMISRSVPGYRDIVVMIGFLAQEYIQPKTNCYDLGCSLGAVTLEILKHAHAADFEMIGVDKSAAMIKRCEANIKLLNPSQTVKICNEDISRTEISNASFIVLNFVLQFIEKEGRLDMLSKLAQGLNPGGVLILSEKIAFGDFSENNFQSDLHHTFKRLNGYSDLEISQKRTALENVLVPETLETHHSNLKKAGFSSSHTWFRCFNFASLIAFK